KDKTGVFTGSYAVNPFSGETMPIFVADYVLVSYGTGAIMAVPGHDERDFEFAEKFDLEIKRVVDSEEELPYTADGQHVKSSFLDVLNNEEAIKKAIAQLEELKAGEAKVTYKLRDWLFSRQRDEGDPIPIIHLEGGTSAAVP